MRVARHLLLLLGALHAPYQCGRAPDRASREETPAEALYGVAGRLRAEGDETAYRSTLRYLITRYPGSRFAAAAQLDLQTDAASSEPVAATVAGARVSDDAPRDAEPRGAQ